MNDIELIAATQNVQILMWSSVVVALVMFVLMGGLLMKFSQNHKLSKYRSKASSMADLLYYDTEVEDGIILLKNGGLMRAFMYEGPDESVLSNLDRNMISDRLNELFTSFDSGYICHIDAIRQPTPNYFDPSQSFFNSKVAKGIDDERRNFFSSKQSMFKCTFIFTVTYLPPTLSQRKLAEAMFEKDGSEKVSQLVKQKAIIQEFKNKTESIYGNLSTIFSNVTPLKSFTLSQGFNGRTVKYDPLLTYIQFCITGKWNTLQVPANPCNLDDLLAVDTEFGIVPLIGNNYVICVVIDSYPAATTPGIFNVLTQFG